MPVDAANVEFKPVRTFLPDEIVAWQDSGVGASVGMGVGASGGGGVDGGAGETGMGMGSGQLRYGRVLIATEEEEALIDSGLPVGAGQ